MKMIVGLGNPGVKYESTRHNVGFVVIDELSRRFGIDVTRNEKEALTGRGQISGRSVMLVKPQTFMNLSGRAVRKLFNYYLEDLEDLVVIYDEIDLPVGSLRIRRSGSPGTHNGMKSIVSEVASNAFPRVRFGVRGENYTSSFDLANYVLGRFAADERPIVDESVDRAVDALVVIIQDDIARAMNEFNRSPNPEEGKGD